MQTFFRRRIGLRRRRRDRNRSSRFGLFALRSGPGFGQRFVSLRLIFGALTRFLRGFFLLSFRFRRRFSRGARFIIALLFNRSHASGLFVGATLRFHRASLRLALPLQFLRAQLQFTIQLIIRRGSRSRSRSGRNIRSRRRRDRLRLALTFA